MMANQVIMSQSLLRAMAEEEQGNLPYSQEQQARDAQVGQRVQEFVRNQLEGEEVLREYFRQPIVF